MDGSIVGKITLGSSSCSGSSFSGGGGGGGGGGVGGFLTTGFPSLSSSTGGGGSGIISLALKSQNSSSYARHNMNIIEIQTVSFGSLNIPESKKRQYWFFEKKSESKNMGFQLFQNPSRIDGFHERIDKEPVML